MKFKKEYLVGITIGLVVIIIDFAAFRDTGWFIPLFGIALTIAWLQIWLDFFMENQRQREIESRFLDFVRNLAGAIKSGMPVAKAISHITKIDYGALSPYAKKLGYQIEWHVPVHKALLLFSNSTRNDVIKRTIATVIEAEQSGGNMEDVLEAITSSLIEIKKIKEERRASISSQVVQSYIIFFIFIGVMIVIQNMLLPYLLGNDSTGVFAGLSGGNLAAVTSSSTAFSSSSQVVMSTEVRFDSLKSFIVTLAQWFGSMQGIFLMLTMIQGMFAGAIIGKLSEGDVTAGFKHSLILMTISFLVMTLFKPGVPG